MLLLVFAGFGVGQHVHHCALVEGRLNGGGDGVLLVFDGVILLVLALVELAAVVPDELVLAVQLAGTIAQCQLGRGVFRGFHQIAFRPQSIPEDGAILGCQGVDLQFDRGALVGIDNVLGAVVGVNLFAVVAVGDLRLDRTGKLEGGARFVHIGSVLLDLGDINVAQTATSGADNGLGFVAHSSVSSLSK